MRKALSMLTAIIFILILSSIVALTISMLSKEVSKTTKLYLYEEAQILARSATEYAIMATQGHDNSINCVNNLNLNYKNTFDINISIYYIGSNFPSGCNILAEPISTDDSNGTAIIDVKVSLNPSLLDTFSPVTYTKRTIQKL